MTNIIIQYNEVDLKQLSNQELLSLVKEINVKLNYLNGHLRKFHKPLFDEILHRTEFLNDFYLKHNKPVPIPARLYCIEHNIIEHPKCQNPNCPNHNFVDWNGSTKSFRKYCCNTCMTSDPNYWERMNKYYMNTLGVPYPLMSKEIQRQTQESIRKNNGGIGFQSKTINQKIQAKNKELYGNEDISKTEHWRRKVKETNNKNLGSDTPFGSKIIQQKCQQTFLDKIGVKYPLMSKEIQNEFQQKIISLYGGLGMQSVEIKQRAITSCNEKYGVDWYQQTSEFQKNKKHKFTSEKYPGIMFDSTWEIIVYDFLTEHNILFEYRPEISLPYEYKETHHTYHPDFLVNGKLYEVKGDNFFRINESTGKEEMFCPYRDEDWSDEKYDWMCGLYEAKYQCMLANNVEILRAANIGNLSEEQFMKCSLTSI